MQLPAINPSLAAPPLAPQKTAVAPNKSTDADASTPRAGESATEELSEADYHAIAELKNIDREVRAHEAAHLAAGGGLTRGGASFSYTQGPDGQRYAVGGEVSIDTSPKRDDPEGTILKAQRIQAAALAPANPSNADRAVAAGAAQMAASARAELMAERYAAVESEGEVSQTDAVSGKNTVAENSKETAPTKDETSTNTRKPEATADIYKLINRSASTESTLGNLLNTTV